MFARASHRLACTLLTTALLGACASYRPLPLDGTPPQRMADITVDAAAMPVAALATHRFDASDGLDVTEVAMLAVANNPELRVLRADAGIGEAQAFAAGLLPDPQLSYEHDYATSSQPDLGNAFNLGLSYDLGNLLTRSSRVSAARDEARQIQLNVLWSEWQTIARARTLFGSLHCLRALSARLDVERQALAPIRASIERTLAAGDLNYDAATSGLNAASDVANKLADTDRQINLAEHGLHTLLGLDPSVALRLVGAPYSARTDARRAEFAPDAMTRRPDLLALQAGYAAQEARLRAAILAQFPAISVGFVRTRDTSHISTSGFSVALALPLFDGNRGNIAIARATRQKLRDEYAARVLADRNDIDRLLRDMASFAAQRAALLAHAKQTTRARVAAERAYAQNLLDWPTYLAIRAAALGVDSELILLQQTFHEQSIALDALIGNWPDGSQAPQRISP